MKGCNIQLAAVCLIAVTTVAGCGGERRSGGDTAAVGDTTAARASDTTRAAMPNTTAQPDTAARRDTAVASTPAPPAARPTPAKKPEPKPVRPTPAQPAESATAAASAPADTTPSATPPGGEATAPLRDAYHQAPVDTVAPLVYNGWKQFNLNCARCHGEDVQGTTIAPHLLVSLRPDGPINTKELFVQTVCAGRPAKGMPAWCALGMDMPTIEAIYAYVKGRSDAKIHPGRPAQREQG